MSPTGIAERVGAVRARVHAAARASGREASAVRLVAATKTVAIERIAEAVGAGIADLGENRAQELLAKAPEVGLLDPSGSVVWHFLGTLQRNKIRALAPWVGWWHSVDRPELGPLLARHAPAARVLVEVNLAGEPQKGGCTPEAAPGLVEGLRACGLDVAGLMTVPPHEHDPRPWFGALRDLGNRLELRELSMGMTDDFEVAIAEGATIVRVGRALFGDRPTP
jgi:pyridoxal phosphate enzyme (YggS family)